MTDQKYIRLEDGRDVPAEDYMMAYAPRSVVERVCEPLAIPAKAEAEAEAEAVQPNMGMT